MKLFRFIIFSVLVLFGVLTAVFSLFPSHIRVSRLISINASKAKVDSLVCDLKSWDSWNQFVSGSALANKKWSAPSSGANAVFTSDQASITVQGCYPDSVLTLWQQKNKRSFTAVFQFIDLNQQTVAEWNFDFYVKWYPWEKMSALFFDKQMGPFMETSLMQLKTLAEKK